MNFPPVNVTLLVPVVNCVTVKRMSAETTCVLCELLVIVFTGGGGGGQLCDQYWSVRAPGPMYLCYISDAFVFMLAYSHVLTQTSGRFSDYSRWPADRGVWAVYQVTNMNEQSSLLSVDSDNKAVFSRWVSLWLVSQVTRTISGSRAPAGLSTAAWNYMSY